MFKMRLRLIALVILALVLSAAVYGFANANSMPADSYAGDGQVAVSGFTISNIHYSLNATTPANVDEISFTLNRAVAAGGTHKLVVTHSGTDYSFDCDLDTIAPTCDLTGGTTMTVLGITNLRIIAAD